MHGINNLVDRVPAENLSSIFGRPSPVGRSGGEDYSRRGGVRRRIRVRVLTGKERGIVAEYLGERADEIHEVGGRINPVLEIGDADESGAVDVGVVGFDEHVGGGIEEDGGRGEGVAVDEPDGCRDVVDDVGEDDGDGAVGLEEIDGAAVVVCEGGGLGVERREGFEEEEEVLPDEEFCFFGVGEGGRAALREGGAQELKDVMACRIARSWRWRWRHCAELGCK